MTTYYIDSASGNNANNGTSTSTPYLNINGIGTTVAAGTTVLFKAGQTHLVPGFKTITVNGTAAQPCVFDQYGSGANPILDCSSTTWPTMLQLNGAYTTVQNLTFTDPDVVEAVVGNTGSGTATSLYLAGSNQRVTNCEFSNTGIGVKIAGSNNRADHCYIHNLVMVVNDTSTNNDYGAQAFLLGSGGSNTTIDHNTVKHCNRPSHDYGFDGSAIEVFNSLTGALIYNNWFEDVNNCIELGANTASTVSGMELHHNIVTNLYALLWFFNTTGTFATSVPDFKFNNNTVHKYNTVQAASFMDFGGLAPTQANALYVQNNIFHIQYASNVYTNPGTTIHLNNRYYLVSNVTTVGVTYDTSEAVGDPLFVNASTQNYNLAANSPCIQAGISLGYTADYNDVTLTGVPDIGALKFVASANNPTGSLIDAATPGGAMPVGDTTANYTLTFSDEFNGAGVNHTRWAKEYGTVFGVSVMSETNYDTAFNAGAAAPSCLRVWPPTTISVGTYNDHVYGSAPDRIFTTQSAFSQTGGYFECKMSIPVGGGPWPSFWLFEDPPSAGINEIDVLEAFGKSPSDNSWTGTDANSKVVIINPQMATHGTSNNLQVKYADPSGLNPPFPENATLSGSNKGVHVYGLRWDPNAGQIQMFIDGVACHGNPFAYTPKNPLFMLLQLSWLDNGLGTNKGPSVFCTNYNLGSNPVTGNTNPMLVDYVRVWQLGASTPSPSTSPPNIDPTTPNRVMPLGDTSGNWTINFSDEFNKAALDTTRWVDVWPGDTSNHVETNYDSFAARNSALRIWPPSSVSTGDNFGSGNFYADPARIINTEGKYTQQFGYFEARIQANKGTYCVDNFWLINIDQSKTTASYSEFDVAKYNTGDVVDGYASNPSSGISIPIKAQALAYDDSHLLTDNDTYSSADFSGGYRVVGIKWDATSITGYFDGAQAWTSAITATTAKNLLLSLTYNATGQYTALTSTNPPRGSTNAMQIDYVRCWLSGAPPVVNFWGGQVDPTTPSGVMPYGDTTNLYTLKLSDEFNLNAVNVGLWTDFVWYGSSDFTKNYDSNRNGNSMLDIWPDAGFVSRTITTDGKIALGYGYYEIYAKLPNGKGPAPLFWMTDHSGSTRPGIDIMKAYSGGSSSGWANASLDPVAYQGNVWIDSNVSSNGGTFIYQSGLDLSAGWHRYGVRYDVGGIGFYFDGVLVNTYANPFPLNQTFALFLSLNFGGPSGTPDSTTPISTPNSLEIDYVRGWDFISANPGPSTAGGGYNTCFNVFRNNRYR